MYVCLSSKMLEGPWARQSEQADNEEQHEPLADEQIRDEPFRFFIYLFILLCLLSSCLNLASCPSHDGPFLRWTDYHSVIADAQLSCCLPCDGQSLKRHEIHERIVIGKRSSRPTYSVRNRIDFIPTIWRRTGADAQWTLECRNRDREVVSDWRIIRK